MSRKIENPIVILNAAAADVAQANGTWNSIERVDQVFFDIQIVGTATVTLDFALNNNNSTVVTQNNFTANNQVVLDDPMGQVRAWSNGVSTNESAVVTMRRIFFHQR